MTKRQFSTRLIHDSEEPRIEGAVSLPIFQSATYRATSGDETTYDDIRYLRLSNSPNHQRLAQKLAGLCEAEAALVTGSGMAAISTTLLSLVKTGDHILAQDCLYGGTLSFLHEEAPGLGIDVDFVDAEEPDSWAEVCRPQTRLFYVETMSNPLLKVPDLPAVVDFCQQHSLTSLIDNTFASPALFQPLSMGFDVELHSATKYLNGHSDIVAGCVASTREHISTITHRLNHLGGILDPHACFLLHRGLKTLELRMTQQCHNAQMLAERLQEHPDVSQVHYPGLSSHPAHQRASEWFGGCGGVLSFSVVGDGARAQRLLNQLTLAVDAPSLGGVETLVSRPAVSSHAGQSAQQRQTLGISDQLIRVAVGIEAAQDLWDDFEQALDASAPQSEVVPMEDSQVS
ncbi:MAG TPA: aminotransferase class I/II-fold pyridoxal phosphate-dependent enzyme [Candidatus Latescibacteria bacterium]|jgi:cystathionine beta-lyase/cystathionine gamma-synthase|nr:cystathionine beta-lyase [Gemmatimonadota bacterium]MDP7361747.1 aminotransferase class I/II-fold pyridoxal phosphate-dependent enzyme [Candidatus Latescibacterota bacterium]HJN30664.1 aminotransferase class I/II-fold pyridoxal phosphate-dependent enzyme [Candidatus Latescibacterota bacterium]